MKIQKKSIMGPIISVFVLVLIVSILAGLTFLFVANLKTTALATSDRTSLTVVLEEISEANLEAGVEVAGTSYLDANSFVLTGLLNATDDTNVAIANATLTTDGVITNASNVAGYLDGYKINYTLSYIAADDGNAYVSINETESAGAGIVGYLPLIFLAIIFGAILTLVLKVILPYINLGQNMGGF